MSQMIGGVRVLASAMTIALGTTAPTLARDITERVSLARDGVQGNGDSTSSAISADGRFVAFASYATNLVPGDTNGVIDVFVRDRQTRTTRRVSLGPGGRQGDSHSFGAAISANGRFVAFSSAATNLAAADTNASVDVFVRDRQSGATQRVSLGPDGVQSNGGSFTGTISADGRFVAFASYATNLVRGDTNRERDVFVHDRKMGATRRVSLGPGGRQSDGPSGIYDLSLSADGRFIAFDSFATNLGPGDTNDTGDVFVHDRKIGTTQRVSRGPGGVPGNRRSTDPAMSADGRFIAFNSDASNLVPGDTIDTTDVFVHDRKIGTTRRVSLGPGSISGNGSSISPAISADGRFVAFFSDATNLVPGDTNGVRDVFVRNLPP